MLTNAKINLVKYLILSSLLLIAIYLLAKNSTEIKVMLVVFCAACLNQWMLVNVVRAASQNAANGTPVNKFNMVAMIIGKVFLLIAALSFGVQIMGNRIIIPVLIYVLQIIVLYLSFDRSKSEN
jgi:hypothetical protein